MSLNSTTAKVNGEEKTLDVAPTIIENELYVPIRFVAENFGFEVEWLEEKRSVKMTQAYIEDMISGDISLSGNEVIVENVVVSGDEVIEEDIVVSGDEVIEEDIVVSGDEVIEKDTVVSGDKNISGDTLVEEVISGDKIEDILSGDEVDNTISGDIVE